MVTLQILKWEQLSLIFWIVAWCSLVNVLPNQGDYLLMEAAVTFEISVNFYTTIKKAYIYILAAMTTSNLTTVTGFRIYLS